VIRAYLLLLAVAAGASAQPNAPHLAYVYPAGAQKGATVQVKAGGQFLANVNAVSISGDGVQASVVEYARPMNGMQATQLRERAQELQKNVADPAARKEIAEIRRKLATFNRNMNPVLAETETIRVNVSPGAAPGRRELRLISPQGMSNPMVFVVGDLPEYAEKQSDIRTLVPGLSPDDIAEAMGSEMSITLPVTVNGRILPHPARPPLNVQQHTPADVDRYRFQARRGQHIVIAVSARELIPYLADAVPGWFQPAISLLDSRGREVAYNDDYRFHPDPVIHYDVPEDGEYVVAIKDAIFRGREDFVYRMTIGEVPFVTGIFPLGGRAGSRSAVAVTGWNVPARKLPIDTKSPGIHSLPAREGEPEANRIPYAVDSLPEMLEKEPNNALKGAQKVKLPVIINGRIDRPGDQDVFAIRGRAGEEIVAEVWARRLESPLDSVLRLTDAAGKQLAFNDDHDDKAFGLLTHQADSLLSATLPANGAYYLWISDAEHHGGPEYAYRLRVSHPLPDFELRVTPSAINAARGMAVPITIWALRRDGFSGEIAIALKGAPRGVTLSGGVVPAGQDHVRLTLTVPPGVPGIEPFSIALEGRGTIDGHEVVREALPADQMMQAFAWTHLVPARDLKLALARRVVFRSPARVIGNQPVKIPAGGSARVQVQLQLPPNADLRNLHYELSDPPEGIALGDASAAAGGAEIVVRCDGAKAKSGTRGNLIIAVSAERQGNNGNVQRVALGVLPAVPFEIVSR
jgi:hypothetical protein